MYSIEISNLTKKFKEKIAVNNISLKIKEGELFALLGTNGAGKTTTIKMLSTLILPTSGEVKINGLDVIKDRQKVTALIDIVKEAGQVASMGKGAVSLSLNTESGYKNYFVNKNLL